MQNLYEPSGKQRIQSIDILRGAIMLIMALDHTRDFFHKGGPMSDPTHMATTTVFLFFTRWITHFCAPAFIFLSGVSAYLAGTRRTPGELSAFLIKRGLWLIFAEFILLSFAFSFDPFYHVFVMQVLWATGVSMVLLGLLVRAPLAIIAFTGAIIFFGHDILTYVQLPKTGAESVLLTIFFTARAAFLPFAPHHAFFVLYAVLPWTSVMLLGYVFGSLYTKNVQPHRRKNILLITGLSLITVGIVLRIIDHYGDPSPWSVQRNFAHSLLSFLNASKYPPSLFYLCMTLGPVITILALIENVNNRVTSVFKVYGNVPFFYYILHFYIIHLLTVVLFFASGRTVDQIDDHISPFLFRPVDFGYNLAIVYLIWFCIIASLYLPCRWFSNYKKTHNQWWLSYL